MFDIESRTGGQATSITLDETQHGAGWLNDGVQGGSSIFQHTFRFFRRYGYEPQPVKLQVSFGKGRDSFWTNVFPSPLVEQCSGEIKKLGRVLKCIKYLMPIIGVLPVKVILRIFRFRDDFSNKMVLPLLALFLGTGNQTPNVPIVLLERLFEDPQMKLWDYDPDTLLLNLPVMYTFPNLGNFYRDWAEDLDSKGVEIRLNCTIEILERGKKGVLLRTQFHDDCCRGKANIEIYDEVVLCCPADEAKKLLDRHGTWTEKYILGGVKFYNDPTITHSDSNYFQQFFESQYSPDLCAASTSESQKKQIAFAEQQPLSQKDGWQGFRPMYFTHSSTSDPEEIEMGFDCTNYQHQFRESLGMDQPSLPPSRHVFQTIFLNDQQEWWHQFGHQWQYYLRVVPGMILINGSNRTLYAGSWTMVASRTKSKFKKLG